MKSISKGLHNITVYANDTFGNVGASQTITFDIANPEQPFPTVTVATISGAIAVIVGVAGFLLYFKKHKAEN